MTANRRRLLFWSVPLMALAAGLVLAFRPQPLDVDLVAVSRGPLIESVAEEGKTRIKDVFAVNAPIRGRALRIEIKEGDDVVAGETLLAEIEPIDPEFLDVRSAAEARAAVETSRAALALARAELTQARAELDFATAEVERVRHLRTTNTVSVRALEDAERSFRTREAAVATAEAGVEMRQSELTAAQVRLLGPVEARTEAGGCPCVPIKAPVNGKVLRVLHESEGVVDAGQPLIEIGDPGQLEVVADFLSTDATRIDPGLRVIIEDWGGAGTLNGRVRRIEPFGFTKVSALGIEEQRVNVVIDLTDPPERWRRLGHGFQVEVRVVLWEDSHALKGPLTALFRNGGDWAVFKVSDGRAVLQPVEVGHGTETEIEFLSGLSEADTVIQYPSNSVVEGMPVRQR